MHLQVDTPSPIPVRRLLAEQREPGIEGGAVRRAQTLPGSRELTGFLDPNTVTRAIEDLKRSGYRPLHSRPEPRDPSSIQAVTSTTLDVKEDAVR